MGIQIIDEISIAVFIAINPISHPRITSPDFDLGVIAEEGTNSCAVTTVRRADQIVRENCADLRVQHARIARCSSSRRGHNPVSQILYGLVFISEKKTASN